MGDVEEESLEGPLGRRLGMVSAAEAIVGTITLPERVGDRGKV
jgi:hypothetical protein